MYEIRKISIGPDYKTAMHYIVGQRVLNDTHEISLVNYEDGFFKIWIINDSEEVILWKSFNSSMPTSIEHNINF